MIQEGNSNKWLTLFHSDTSCLRRWSSVLVPCWPPWKKSRGLDAHIVPGHAPGGTSHSAPWPSRDCALVGRQVPIGPPVITWHVRECTDVCTTDMYKTIHMNLVYNQHSMSPSTDFTFKQWILQLDYHQRWWFQPVI